MKKFFSQSRDNSTNFIAPTSLAHQFSYFAAFIFLFSCSFERQAAAQAPADQTADRTAVVRPCPTLPVNSKPARKEKTKRKGAADSNEAPPACLEAKASSLDIQEFLQSFIREQKWSIGEEKVAEDAWTFFRYLDKDELLRFADVGPFAGRVNWTEGKAFVKVNTVDAGGGFTRVLITARFEGHGQNADLFAPPQESWKLTSNGSLEKSLVSSLETHFQSLH
jgi:hypothetical protein